MKTKIINFSLGFKSILQNIARQWDTKRDQLIHSGDKIVEALSDASKVGGSTSEDLPDADDVAKRCLAQLAGNYDDEFGGFSQSPKFPQPGLSELLKSRQLNDFIDISLIVSWMKVLMS